MLARERIRRIAKWTGVGIFGVIVAAWVVSLRCDIGVPLGRPRTLWLNAGRVTVQHGPNVYRTMMTIGWPAILRGKWIAPDLRWLRYRNNVAGNWFLDVPLWLLLLACAIPTAVLFYRDRRRIPPGHCTKCGYNLHSNTSGICPECGQKTAAHDSPERNPSSPAQV